MGVRIYPLGDPNPVVLPGQQRYSLADDPLMSYNVTDARRNFDRNGLSERWPAQADDISPCCDRCGHPVERDQQVRYKQGYAGAIHDGCSPPEAYEDKQWGWRVGGKRTPKKCPECNVEHAGEPGDDCL